MKIIVPGILGHPPVNKTMPAVTMPTTALSIISPLRKPPAINTGMPRNINTTVPVTAINTVNEGYGSMVSDEWIADLGAMECWNVFNKIVVVFKINGLCLEGKIKYIPFELLAEWARDPRGERKIERAVREAEEVFINAYLKGLVNSANY